MRQRVTQLESMLRSFVDPNTALEYPSNYSASLSDQSVDAAVNGPALSNSTQKSQSDIDMNDGDKALDESDPSPGQLTSDNSRTSYVGSAHWGAVLNEVSRICSPYGS